MRKTLSVIGLLLILSGTASATTVTATVTDPNSVLYANATYAISFQPAPGTKASDYLLNGATFTGRDTPITGSLNSSGVLSVTLSDNTTISPSGSTWTFRITSANGTNSFTVGSVLISGSSVSLTTQLSAGASAILGGVAINSPTSGVGQSQQFIYKTSGQTAPAFVLKGTDGTSLFQINADGTCTPSCTGGGGGTPGGTSGQVQFNNSGAFGGFTVSGDSTLNTATGVMANTGMNGVQMASLASGLVFNATITGFPSIANSAQILAACTGCAPLASPAFTGIPTAPTATVGTNTTQLATTAFVLGQSFITAITGGTCTNQAVTAISTAGVPTCTTLNSAYVNNTIALTGTDINTSNQVTATHLSSALPVAQGGTGATTAAQNSVFAGPATGGAGAPSFQAAPTISAANMTNFPALTQAFPVTVTGGVSGAIPCFTSTTVESAGTLLTANVLTKGGGAGVCPGNSSITDNGTTVSSTEPVTATSFAAGTSPPTCAPGTAGGMCAGEGTAVTAVSAVDDIWADSTSHAWMAHSNGGSPEMIVMSLPGSINLTGQTASIATATLCAASAGACNQAGLYHVHFAMEQTGTACTANTTNGTLIKLTWTDSNGTAHSAQTIPLITNASLTGFATSGIMAYNATTLGAFASGDLVISSNGSVIQYATTYQNCTTGTATYEIRGSVVRLQ